MDARWRSRRWLLVLFVLLPLSHWLGGEIAKDPAYPKEYNQPIVNVREGGTVAIMAMMGGLRPMVANLLWLKIEDYSHAGAAGYWRMVPVLQTVCELDPHFIEAWSTFGWHCAYNVYNDAAKEDRPQWIAAAIEIYKRGQYFNPKQYDLFKDLAFLYHDKLRDYNRAEQEWRRVVRLFPNAPLPCWHELAHCYEYTWQVGKAVAVWKKCLKKDPADGPALSAYDWWMKQTASPELLRAELLRVLDRENSVRLSRGLSAMAAPYPLTPERLQAELAKVRDAR